MPNHVTNKIFVEGPASRVQALLKQGRIEVHTPAGKNFLGVATPARVDNLEFSLGGFIPPPKHPDYTSGSCGHQHDPNNDPNPNCWYPWNRKNWGTKWDCYDVRVESNVETVLESLARGDGKEARGTAAIYFDTAWCPPMPVIEKIVEDYADLDIDFTYMDEDMFGGGGGRILYRNGEPVNKQTGINDKNDPLFVEIATDLKNYDPADYEEEEETEEEETDEDE